MKIIGFSQLKDELSKGNLGNWFRTMEFCDYIYIYDQNSEDGSKDYYKKFKNCTVIESPTNDFKKEVICKSILLDKLLKDHPDTNWICWIDGDTLIDNRLTKNNCSNLLKLLKTSSNYDAINLGHLNLWRSDLFYRVDNDYDWLNKNGVTAFWRNNGKLKFPSSEKGLHIQSAPNGITSITRANYYLIHRGFSTDEQILRRYTLYKSLGQSGYPLERLLDEKTLDVKMIPPEILPDWFKIQSSINPKEKEKIRK